MEILSLGIAILALLLIGAFLLGDSYGRRSERKKFIDYIKKSERKYNKPVEKKDV